MSGTATCRRREVDGGRGTTVDREAAVDALNRAHRRAEDLWCLIRDEVEEAKGQRELLIDLDAEALFTRAARRDAFNANAAAMQEDIASRLREAADALGLEAATFEALEAALPEAAGALRVRLSEVGALAAELRRIDEANLLLGRRAIEITRGYLEALVPGTSAYDRTGRPTGPITAAKGQTTIL